MTKNMKIEKILGCVFEKMKTYLTIEYCDLIEYNYFDDIKFLMDEILTFLKNVNLENVKKFKYGVLSFDDYYCIVLYDENENIIDFIVWDFDFDIFDDELFHIDYRFCDCKNNDEILNKFDFDDFKLL